MQTLRLLKFVVLGFIFVAFSMSSSRCIDRRVVGTEQAGSLHAKEVGFGCRHVVTTGLEQTGSLLAKPSGFGCYRGPR